MDTNIIGRPTNPFEPCPNDQKILWIVVLDLTSELGNATGWQRGLTTRRLATRST